jgi:hypothetical protein
MVAFKGEKRRIKVLIFIENKKNAKSKDICVWGRQYIRDWGQSFIYKEAFILAFFLNNALYTNNKSLSILNFSDRFIISN